MDTDAPANASPARWPYRGPTRGEKKRELDEIFEREFRELVPRIWSDPKPEDIAAWNRWWWSTLSEYEKYGLEPPPIPFNLEKIEGLVLNVDWSGIALAKADLRNKNFRLVVLDNANLAGANLQGSWLLEAPLRNANLDRTDLSGADLWQAVLHGASLRSSNLRGARLQEADLREADLRAADLSGAIMQRANLDRADLREVCGARYDDNPIRDARFTARFGPVWKVMDLIIRLGWWIRDRKLAAFAGIFDGWPSRTFGQMDDPWSKLRRSYTGINFALILLFSLLFAAPIALKTIGLVALSEAERRASALLKESPMNGSLADRSLAARVRDSLAAKRQYQIWQVLLGVHRGDVGVAILMLALVTYNATRYVVTISVAPLRESEERSGVTPARIDYLWLSRLSRVVEALWWVATAASLYNFWRIMTSDVVVLW